METEILKKIDEIEEQMIEAIKSIVRIDSVKSKAQPGMPFGKGVNDALQATLKLCEELGFETENVDGRMGIAKYGQGEDYIGVIGHLDVVPVGDGWKHEPFGAEEVNGRIFGRGILDNKGPVLSCLFALYVLKELNVKLNHPVWILFGTDEESGFEDFEYYLTKKKPPIMGWTPDCKYPVVYAERGRAAIRVYADIKHQKEFNHFVNEYLLTSDDHANKLGLNIVDEEFGAMQLRGKSLIDCDEDLGFEFVLSYPASITIEEIMDKVKSKLYDGISVECAKNYDPVRFEKTGFLCSSLQKAYEKITGFDGTPVTTTGGTYAKLMPNIVPFGPSFPGQKGIGHNPDEWMDRKDLMTNAKIYALSLLYLGLGE